MQSSGVPWRTTESTAPSEKIQEDLSYAFVVLYTTNINIFLKTFIIYS